MNNKIKYIALSRLDAYRIARDTLNTLYQDESNKKFIHHLIYSFNVTKPVPIVFSKSKLYDCLTRSALNTVINKEVPLTEKIKALYELTKEVEEDEKEAVEERLFSEIEQFIKDNNLERIAYRSNHTNKFLGADELQALRDFIIDQINEGNETILKLVKYINPDLVPKNKKTPKFKKNKFRSSKVEISKTSIGADEDTRNKLMGLKNQLNK